MKIIINRFYRILFLSILLSVSGTLYAQKETLKILHTSDIHTVYNLDKCNPIFYNLRKRLLGASDSLKNFFAKVPNKVDADMVVITGDLIDYFEADINKSNKVSCQVQQFATVTELCPVPLYLTLGNHCLTSYWINEEDSSKMQTQVYADKVRAEFIRNISCFKHGTYYKKIFEVGKVKYHLFFLDNGSFLPDGRYDKTQLAWLEQELKNVGDDPVILFAHRYYVIGDINGDGILFKKDAPTEWPREGSCNTGMLKIINEHKNIKALVVGHGHQNVWEKITFPSGHEIYQIETATLYDKSSNWRIIKLTEDAIIVNKAGTNETEIEIK